MSLLEKIKRLFMSKKKKLILDIKKKHNKNITDSDINDYRRKHKMYPYSTSDNDILDLMLLGDLEIKSTHPRNTEKVEDRTYSESYTPSSLGSTGSSRSSKSSRNDDSNDSNYSSYSSYDSGSSSSSDSCSSSSCD
jgi:hypothetical protein